MSSVETVTFPIPLRFRRGSLRQDERASVKSALALIELMDGVIPVNGATILDYGCGVKIVQGLMQLGCPQKRYVGLDVNDESIRFLRENCADSRFEFHFIDFLNRRYNPLGAPMAEVPSLPVDSKFDLQVMFSVVTHLEPQDARCALALLRQHAHAGTKLLFSAFVDPDQKNEFEDLVPEKPLLKASYKKSYLEQLVQETGWSVLSYNRAIAGIVQRHYVCAPV